MLYCRLNMASALDIPYLDIRCHCAQVASFDIPLHRVPRSNVTTVMDVVACTDAQHGAPVSNYLIDHVRIPFDQCSRFCLLELGPSSACGLCHCPLASPVMCFCLGCQLQLTLLRLQCKAERTALCDSDDAAQRASRLPHVQQAFMPDGSKWYMRGQASVRPGLLATRQPAGSTVPTACWRSLARACGIVSSTGRGTSCCASVAAGPHPLQGQWLESRSADRRRWRARGPAGG